ncbi:MAG: hypothetical protein ABEJ83_03085 [Candidatus Nanohaloarchaea archaeon]
MLPEKHLDDLEQSVKKKKLYSLAGHTLLFAASYLFIAPLIHETVHIIVLAVSNCFYETNWSFNIINGLRATVQPHCSLNKLNQLIFYLSGYLTTLGSAVAILAGSKKLERYGKPGFAVASGLLLSLVGNISLRGDLKNLRLLLDAPVFFTWLIYLGILAACFLLIFELYEA